jgi:hypothetical protein
VNADEFPPTPEADHLSPEGNPLLVVGTLVAAQGLSALADHALLIVGMARLAELALPAWWAPLLKLVFTLAYVLLAPVVGAWADSQPKASA